MRIVFIAGEFPPLQGGLGDFTRELARACRLAGHEVHVFTRAAAGAPDDELLDGVAVHRRVSRWGWATWKQVAGFVQRVRPDVLNVQYQAAAYHMHPAINLLPLILSRRAPVVVTFHDLRTPYLFPKAGPLRRQAILGMACAARAVIVTNVEDDVSLRQAGLREVFRIPIGSNITPADLTGFDRCTWLRCAGSRTQARVQEMNEDAPERVFVVGYFGFLNESKGGETLIRALALLRDRGLDIKLLLIGGQTGDSDPTNQQYAHALMALADELSVRTQILSTGFVDARAVSEAFAACDCVALPYRDGASLRRGTLMAALAHGAAIVTTTPRVELPELQHEENVLLVPADQPAALADAIRRVLTDSELRRRLQAAARRTAALFNWEHIAAETVCVFERARSR
ncbi:MAG: glycosyltransferase [Anaerolineae bacterium]|nr:glycosyltransferase [Thermoflexales bacterium]MDW8406800.1 glycosyltransferase [Anaerolineae bacterium]